MKHHFSLGLHDNKYDLWIPEEDCGALYAFLLKDDHIISDVWLYNLRDAPADLPWLSSDSPPFLNPAMLSVPQSAQVTFNGRQPSVKWIHSEREIVRIIVLSGQDEIAEISPWVRPGWCVNAKNSGPLARTLPRSLIAVRNALDRSLPSLKGQRVDWNEHLEMHRQFSLRGDIDWLLSGIFSSYRIAGTEWHLDENEDESGLGVEMKWMSPREMQEEMLDLQPGIAALSEGYLPVGTCLNGSGDPYFIRIGQDDPPLVRIPHAAVSDDLLLVADQVEVVARHLSAFFNTGKCIQPG